MDVKLMTIIIHSPSKIHVAVRMTKQMFPAVPMIAES